MSRYTRKIDRVAAERLLGGEPADPRRPDDLLAALLATMSAPARAGELAGEEAAVAAFRQARAAHVRRAARPAGEVSTLVERPAQPPAQRLWKPVPVRRSIRHPARLTLVALSATTAGGVALAAGSVPWSQRPDARRPATASPTPSHLTNPDSGRARGGAIAATAHPSLMRLCRAYQAGAGGAPGKALDNPAFTALIEAAGGKDEVAAYCADMLAAKAKRAKKSTPPGRATSPDRPREAGQSGQPSPPGQTGSTSRPSRRPTASPTRTAQPPDKTPHTRAPQTRLLSA